MNEPANRWALLAGMLFGIGLLLSGMADPKNVLGFLDFSRNWNPRLIFVMGTGVLVAAPAFWWVRRHGHGFSDTPIHLPARWPLDARLITGAMIFGFGWGLSGLCPGPALVGAAAGSMPILVFVIAMALGMCVTDWVQRHKVRT